MSQFKSMSSCVETARGIVKRHISTPRTIEGSALISPDHEPQKLLVYMGESSQQMDKLTMKNNELLELINSFSSQLVARERIYFAHIGQAIPNALVIRPEDIQIVSHSTKDNVWPAKVEQVIFLGAIYDCRLALGEMTLRAQFPRSAVVQLGQQVYIHVAERRCVPIED